MDLGWKKAIPEARDRLQSRVLVGVVGALLVLETIAVLQPLYFLLREQRLREDVLLIKIVGISVVFAGLVLLLRAATAAGALFGGFICFLLVSGTTSYQSMVVRSGLAPLALLFVLTFLATRAGRAAKARAGLAEKRHGRSAAQLSANLSVAALAVSGLGFELVTGGGVCCGGGYSRVWVWPAMMMMCLAAMVEATADTVSSEIGQVYGGRPVMLMTMRRVDPGTDGGVTLLGSFAGVASGAFVAVGECGRSDLVFLKLRSRVSRGFAGCFSTVFWGRLLNGRDGLGMIL